MDEREFLSEVEAVFLSIEQWLEDHAPDIDFETQQGILTIDLPSGKQMIISRQLPLKEIWVACPNGAYHFQKIADRWITKKQEPLFDIIQLQMEI